MNLPELLAKHMHDVHFGGNWTSVNLKETLADVTWNEAVSVIPSFNTIATLAYHIHYYVDVVTKVLEGQPLNASDKLSFSHPAIASQDAWEVFTNKLWLAADKFTALIKQLPEQTLWENFTDEKYGSYYRNLQGIIEHTHYHMGQIVILKKMLRSGLMHLS